MGRHERSPESTVRRQLETQQSICVACGGPLWVAYHKTRTISTLQDVMGLTLVVRRCQTPTCSLYHQPYRPEEEGRWALPRSTFGLDVVALVGRLRYADHRSVPEIHRHLHERGVRIAERTVTHLLYRYEELLAVHLADPTRRVAQMQAQGRVILALDGLQPDVGHEVLWVLRECLSGEVLLARSLLSSAADDLAMFLREACAALPVPVAGVISDGQHSIRDAIASALPGVPHQLCQFHYLREAARPLFEADRHAKKELKKQIRGVRPLERAVEGRTDEEAEVVRGYCLAVRSALTDDGRPPLCAAGLRLHERVRAIHASVARIVVKGGLATPYAVSNGCLDAAWHQRSRYGRRLVPSTQRFTAQRRS